MSLCRMHVYKLGIDLIAHDPVVILTDEEETKSLPITIGVFEATAIALAIEQTPVSRPTSHDLISSIITNLGAQVQSVIITEVRSNTFYAAIVLEKDGETIKIDARPSDSIAVALRAKAPIYAEESVLESEGINGVGFDVPASEDDSFYTEERGSASEEIYEEESSEENKRDNFNLEDYLNNLNPSDFDNDESEQ